MRLSRARALLGALLFSSLLTAAWPAADARQSSGTLRWFKGNTHAHTINSDGDSTPDEVVRWYREHGYQFIVLSDHNYVTSVEGLNALMGAVDKFLIIAGEEVTSQSGNKPIHVNGLAVRETVLPPAAGTPLQMLQRSVDGIRGADGVPHVNHPNFGWAITADELAQLERTRLFEIFNGHPRVNGFGGGGLPSLEEMWDRVLSSGRLMYGLAVDDAHYFKQPWNTSLPGPGRGWVVVRAASLEARALLDALERGDFYASTGVELRDYRASQTEIVVDVEPWGDSKYRVQFVGRHGRVLDEQTSVTARYVIRGDEGYVRAKIVESNGRLAWTQPVPVGGFSMR